MGSGTDQQKKTLIDSILSVCETLGIEPKKLKRDQWLEHKAYGVSSHYAVKKVGGWAKARRMAAREYGLRKSKTSPTRETTEPDPAPEAPPSTPLDKLSAGVIDYQPPLCEELGEDGPTSVDVDPPDFKPRTYVITYAQNATPLEDNFWASLLAYCEERGAELLVIKGRYKNPTSIWSRTAKSHDWWDGRISAYEVDGRLELCPDLVVYGDISIQPTAVRPLTGLEVFTGQAGGVFGHPKIQLTAVANSIQTNSRLLTTTGACTVQNYTESKAGRKGEAHHVFGACVVDLEGDRFTVRQINATADGCFTDLDIYATPYGCAKANRPAALILGDIHHARVSQEVLEATFCGPDSIVETLRPRQIVFHDVLDFQARSHHEIRDPDRMFERAHGGAPNIVEDEIMAAIRFLDEVTPADAQGVVVASNHDEHLERWLKEANPNIDPLNARFYHQLRAERLALYEENLEWVPPFEYCYHKHGQGRVRFLRRDESYVVAGIECGFHGDQGPNGTKGTLLGFARMGAKTVTAHGHSAAIMDGAVCVGTSSELDMGYNSGPSSWVHAHCLIYDTGKRTLLFVNNGHWR